MLPSSSAHAWSIRATLYLLLSRPRMVVGELNLLQLDFVVSSAQDQITGVGMKGTEHCVA